MMLQSHLLGSLLLGALLARAKPLRPRDWALALGFGVAIDLDHALQLPAYVASHGVAGLQPASMLHWGAAWQGFMHTPWALLLVGAAAAYWRTPIPALFWGLHMVQDFVVARHFVVWGSPEEWIVGAALLATVVALFWDDHRRHGAGRPFSRHFLARFGFVFR